MKRREFGLHVTAMALWAPTLPARAQGGPVEGRDYVRVAQPVPVPEGKVDVIEFFGYWCPHCHAFEPALDAWAKKLPASANFRRMAVAFNASQEQLQRLYFAIETMGLVDTLHRKVFAAVHVERKRLGSDADVADFAKANGVDPAKLLDTMKSAAVANKVRESRQLDDAFGISGVPTLGIHGRFMTSPSIAGSPERALATADALIATLIKG